MTTPPPDVPEQTDDRFEAVANASVDGLLVIDADGVVQYASPAAVSMFAEQTEELVGFHLGTPAVQEPTELQLSGRKAPLHVEIRASDISWQGRDATLANLRDITERKRVVEALRRSEELLNETGDMARVGGWEIDLQTEKVIWTRTTRDIHEVPNSYVPTLEAAIDFFPEAKQELTDAIRRAREEGVSFDLELPFVTAKGNKLWTHAIGKPEFRDGVCVRLHGTFQDITDRKSADEEISRTAKQLQLAQQIAKVGNWELDPAIGIPQWSEEVFRIYERDPKLGPIPLAEYSGLYSEKYLKIFESAISAAVQHGTPYSIELFLCLPSGNEKWIHAICQPDKQKGPHGHFLHGTIQDITETKHREAELAEAKAILQTAMDQSTAGIAIADAPSGKLRYVNDAGLLIRGEKREHVVNGVGINEYVRTWRLFDLDGTPLETDQVPLARAVKYGETNEREFIIRRSEGDERVVLARAAPIIREDEVVAAIVVFLDVTERKRADRALRSSEARYKRLAENSPAVVYQFRLAPDGSISIPFITESVQTVLGVSATDVMQDADALLEMIHPDHQQAFRESVIESAQNLSPYEQEIQAVTDGKPRWFEAVATPERQLDSSVLWDGFFLDITERKKQEKTLFDSQERFRRLLEDFPLLAVQGYRPDGTTIYWNKGSENIYGYTNEEALGRSLLDLIIPPDMRDAVKQAVKEMTETGIPHPASELQLMHKDGSRVPVFSCHMVLTYDEQPPELYCFDLELTDIKRAEEERRKLQEQLAQSQRLESIGQLAGGVAHDFNNLLTVILGHTEMAIRQLQSDDPTLRRIEEIRKCADRAAHLTRQLLAFARKQTIEPEILDLNTTVEGMLKMLRRLIGEDIDLRWQPANHLPKTKMDPAQVDQILVNLCVNARDAIAGQGTIVITTECTEISQAEASQSPDRTPGTYVTIAVTDSGSGMSPETQQNIFEPFFTTKERDKGTGLGLATVFGIVKQNNGFIDVQSELEKGSTFTISVPALPPNLEQTPSEQEEPLQSGQSEIIMIAEDDAGILDMIHSMLSELNYQILAAGSPEEVLSVAQDEDGPIDLLITDVVMPSMNARELVMNIREFHPDIKCLYMSGYTDNIIADRGVLQDDVHFLHKPFTIESLASKIREALER